MTALMAVTGISFKAFRGIEMEIMGKGYMIIPVILFVVGIVVSLRLSDLGIERVQEDK